MGYNSQLLNARSQKAVFLFIFFVLFYVFQSYLSSLACRNLGGKYKRTVEFYIHTASTAYSGVSWYFGSESIRFLHKIAQLGLVWTYLFLNPGWQTRTGHSRHMHRGRTTEHVFVTWLSYWHAFPWLQGWEMPPPKLYVSTCLSNHKWPWNSWKDPRHSRGWMLVESNLRTVDCHQGVSRIFFKPRLLQAHY